MSIPEALMTRPMATVCSMNIDTRVLEPIVITDDFCRFVLPPIGILDTGSAISFVLTNPGTGGFLPIKTGIHALIRRAVLRIGTKVVARSDDYPQYATIRRSFKTMEEKRMKDAIKSGTLDCVGPDQRQNDGLQLADVVYDNTDAEVAETGRTGTPLSQSTLTNDAAHGPMYSIRISELFPMMRNVQLPLYLISSEAPASIELTFNTQPTGVPSEGTLACFPAGTADTSVILHKPSVKFLADFLTYDDNRMDALAKQVMSSQGMLIPYEDLIVTNTAFEAGADTAEPLRRTLTRELGLAGQRIRSIVMHAHRAAPANRLLGKYSSDAYRVADAFNTRVNDAPVFMRPMQSETQKQHQLALVFGTNLSITNAEYSLDCATNKALPTHPINYNPFLGMDVGDPNDAQADANFASTLGTGNFQTQLLGSQHYIGIDFNTTPLNQPNNGVQVGQKPVTMTHEITTSSLDRAAREVRYYSTVERTMLLQGGQVTVSA
jgi:hypothetical protein